MQRLQALTPPDFERAAFWQTCSAAEGAPSDVMVGACLDEARVPRFLGLPTRPVNTPLVLLALLPGFS